MLFGFIIQKNETTWLFHFTGKMTKSVVKVVDKKARSLRRLSRFAHRVGISYKRAHNMLTGDYDFDRQAKRAHKMPAADFDSSWQIKPVISYDPLRNIDCSPWPIYHTQTAARANVAHVSGFITPTDSDSESASTEAAESECRVSNKTTLVGRLLNCFCRARR